MSKEIDTKIECCEIWNSLKDKTKMIDFLINAKTEIDQLKQENETLFLQLSKQEIDEHKPVYCTLAGTECEYLGKVEELKQQLAEKDEELRKYKSYKTNDERIKDLINLYSQYKEENNQLRKELKDKDFALECKERDIKAIEKQRDKAYDDYGYLDKISRELGLQNVDYEKQISLLKSSEKCLTERIKNQTQLAIQELEKVKDFICDYSEMTGQAWDHTLRFLNNQIKELKGE